MYYRLIDVTLYIPYPHPSRSQVRKVFLRSYTASRLPCEQVLARVTIRSFLSDPRIPDSEVSDYWYIAVKPSLAIKIKDGEDSH